MEGLNSCMETDCFIYYDGRVTCMNPCSHSAYCDTADYTEWPHDVHRCHFEYISRTKNTNQLNFMNNSIYVDAETGRSSGWLLLLVGSESGQRRYIFDDYNSSLPFVVFNFEFQRHPVGYQLQLTVPAAVLMVINVLLLLLSPESADRFVLYVINLFSHMVYIEQLRWMWVVWYQESFYLTSVLPRLPHNGDTTPKVMIYFLDSQFFNVLLIFETVFLKMFIIRKDKPNKFVQDLIMQVNRTKVGQMFITPDTSCDGVDLAEDLKKTSPVSIVRQSFRLMFDRLLFIFSIIVYVSMFKKLFPDDNIRYDQISIRYEYNYWSLDLQMLSKTTTACRINFIY